MTSLFGLLIALSIAQTAPPSPPQGTAQSQTQSPEHSQKPQRPLKWWDDEDTIKLLGLSKRQRARIREKVEAWLPTQRRKVEEMHAAERKLAALLDSATFDVNASARAVEQVEEIRWHLSRSRSLMLLDLLSELQPDQRRKLKEIDGAATPGGGRQWHP